MTFRVEVTGPTALIVAPIVKHLLDEELPPTVDQLVTIAEGAS